MATRTKDERAVVVDAAAETAIGSILTNDNNLTRKDALRLLVRAVVKKDKTNRHRVRQASENPAALPPA